MPLQRLLRFLFALVAELGLLAALNLFDDWTLAEMPVRFVTAGLLCGMAYLIAATDFPTAISFGRQAALFWGVAVALRLLALPLEPGDDLWRYQWEGKIQQAGFNPYVQAPDDPALEPLREEFAAWHKINHRHFRTIYPPGAELVFLALSHVSDRPLLYKLLFAAADLATAAILLLLMPREVRYARAVWYAWNPLVVYCFAGGAHFDSLMILPTLAAVLLLTRFESATNPESKWLLAATAAALLGVAISIKLIPLLLLPLCVFALGTRAVVLAVSISIPVALSRLYGYPEVPIWQALREFAYVARVNDLFWWIIEETVWPNPRQKNYQYNVVIIGAVTLVSLFFYRNWKRGTIWVLGTALILSPVLHPWYCTWILPFAAWRRAQPWHVLSVTLFAYFLFWNERLFALPWRSELWLRGIIMLPPIAAMLFLLSEKPKDEATQPPSRG